MRLLSWSSVLAVIVFSAGPRASAGMDAAAIIEEHLDSRGGDDRILGLTCYQMLGTISQSGRTLPIHIWWKRPNMFRMDVGRGEGAIISAFDGKTAWTVEPGPWGRQASGMMPGEREMFIRYADWEGPLLDPEKKGIRVTPDSKVWGDSGYLFTVQRNSGPSEEVLLNSSMRLMAREVFEVGPPGFEHRVEQRFSKFRRIEGFALPHRIERFVDGGHGDAVIEINEVLIGPSVSETLFMMPDVQYPNSEDLRLVDMEDLSVLREHFHADAGRVRLVAILSPTSSTSRQELLDIRAILDSADDDRMAAYIIWTPILESDSRAAAVARKQELDDPRITHFWDPRLVAEQSWRDVMKLKGSALNLCSCYGPEAQWSEQPTNPHYWIQPGFGSPWAPTMDRSLPLAKLREMLAKAPPDKKKRGVKTSQNE